MCVGGGGRRVNFTVIHLKSFIILRAILEHHKMAEWKTNPGDNEAIAGTFFII